MINLHVDFAGIQLNNPIIVAASDVGTRLDQIREGEHYVAAAFIIKGCIPARDVAGLTTFQNIFSGWSQIITI